jgi:hypothetical protein
MFSVKISELNDRCIEIRNNASNEILTQKQKNEENIRRILRLEKFLIKSKNDINEVVKVKNKEIKMVGIKLLEAEKNILVEDKKSLLLHQKKILALKCNLSKMEASKTKVEEKLKQTELELETEKILRRKKKMKDKNDQNKINDFTSKLTRSIESLQLKIKDIEKEKQHLEEKNVRLENKTAVMEQKRPSSNRGNINKRLSGKCNRNKLRRHALVHSNSNDALFFQSKLTDQVRQSKKELRDLSLKSSINQLNLSEISQGSPISMNRPFSNRSKKRNNNTNTLTTNISFCNSVSGMFKNSVIGTKGDGSSKY